MIFWVTPKIDLTGTFRPAFEAENAHSQKLTTG